MRKSRNSNPEKYFMKNFDILSLCIKEEEGNLWFCRMKKEKIEFEVLESEDPHDLLEAQTHQSFNSTEGPLWRTKMIRENMREQQNMEDIDGEFKFMNNIIFSFHHAFTDGSTSFRVCSGFLQILTDVINGSEGKIYDCFGKFSDGTETDHLIQERKAYLENNSEIFEKLKAEMTDIANQDVLLTDVFPVPPNVCNRTKHLVRDVNIEDTKKLINKFKSEKISFHAGFTAITNWALMELLVENGCSRESIDIGAFHAMNIRRYWKGNNTYFHQGCHIGPLRMLIKTDKSVGNNFWNHAKVVHEHLKNHINGQRPLDEIIAYPLTSKSGNFDFAELFNNPPPLALYYSTTNMGDLSSILPETGDHVKINWLTRSTSCHNLNISMVHILQTFKGKLLYGLDYSTKYVRDDLATKYVDKIFEKILYIINA